MNLDSSDRMRFSSLTCSSPAFASDFGVPLDVRSNVSHFPMFDGR